LKIKEIESLEIVVKNAATATNEIIQELTKRQIKDKIVLLRLSGLLENQKPSDVKIDKIEEFCYNEGAYFVLKNTHDLKTKEIDLNIEVTNKENLEEETIKKYSIENPSRFNPLIPSLMKSLSIEKQEGETVDTFNKRLVGELKGILDLE